MLRFGSKNDVSVSYKCTVRLLDDTEVIECEFQAQDKGKQLLDQVCQQLNLVEKDYFGLRYVDIHKQRHWLDPTKLIVKQVKYMDPVLFSFRVKFYPPDPFRLKEEITRYQVYLQLRRDLLHGRLYCTSNEAALLAAYIVQADLGDYSPDEHEGNYVQELRLLLKQTLQIEEKIMELHQTHLIGQSPQDVETNFLRRACSLDTYGVDPHPVKDHRGNQLYLGINHLGILTFQGSRKTNHFRWPEIHKINYEGKMFIVHLTYNEDPRTKKKHTVGFKCPTGAACRHVWRCAIEQMLFFTLPSGSEVPTVVTGGSFFSWGTKFKYSGRTERELLEEVGPLRQEEPIINRVGSLRRKAASVPATPSTPIDMADIRYSSLPRSNHSVPDSRLDGGPSLLAGNIDGSFAVDSSSPLLETVCEDQEVHTRQRNPGGGYEALTIEHQMIDGYEFERKLLVLSSIAESQAADGLEDIQEEDEEDVLLEEVPLESPVDNKIDSSETCQSGLPVADCSVTDKHVTLMEDIGGGNKGNVEVRDIDTLDAGGPGFNEYYFRDSFEHSSSESQLMETGQGRSHRSSRSQTPVARGKTGSKLSLNSGAIVPTQWSGDNPVVASQGAVPSRSRRLQLRASYLLPALALAALLLAVFAALLLESPQDGPFSALHRLPEVITLRTVYYEPAKEFVRQRIQGWLQ